MPIPKVLIITQSHLCRNPRVLKEARTLSANGYNVIVLNSIHSSELQELDARLIQDYPMITIRHVSDLTKKNTASFIDRAVHKLGRIMSRYFKINTSFALGYGSFRYPRKAAAINADLVICHQEVGAFTGTKILKYSANVAFDIEDWYSEDLLPEARRERPIRLLKKIEKTALKKGIYCTTTSYSMAKKMAEYYSVKVPDVIYNVFPLRERLLEKKKQFLLPLKLFWFSQTIGPGRGIEEFIKVLNFENNNLQLHLLGNSDPSYRKFLTGLVPCREMLFFHEQVPEMELPDKIATFDIGLALELTEPPNHDYTISNKFFQYLQSGIPVIATATAGQQEAFENFKPGFIIPPNPGTADKTNLEIWLNDKKALQAAQAAAKRAAATYCWDVESEKFLRLVKNALK